MLPSLQDLDSGGLRRAWHLKQIIILWEKRDDNFKCHMTDHKLGSNNLSWKFFLLKKIIQN